MIAIHCFSSIENPQHCRVRRKRQQLHSNAPIKSDPEPLLTPLALPGLFGRRAQKATSIGAACRFVAYCDSFNGKLRDDYLNGDIFYLLKEPQTGSDRHSGGRGTTLSDCPQRSLIEPRVVFTTLGYHIDSLTLAGIRTQPVQIRSSLRKFPPRIASFSASLRNRAPRIKFTLSGQSKGMSVP
jgi:hypothetical protein